MAVFTRNRAVNGFTHSRAVFTRNRAVNGSTRSRAVFTRYRAVNGFTHLRAVFTRNRAVNEVTHLRAVITRNRAGKITWPLGGKAFPPLADKITPSTPVNGVKDIFTENPRIWGV